MITKETLKSRGIYCHSQFEEDYDPEIVLGDKGEHLVAVGYIENPVNRYYRLYFIFGNGDETQQDLEDEYGYANYRQYTIRMLPEKGLTVRKVTTYHKKDWFEPYIAGAKFFDEWGEEILAVGYFSWPFSAPIEKALEIKFDERIVGV